MGGRLSSPVLVGREEELHALREATTHALGGGSRLVLLGGDAGIGKTRLVAELMRERADMRQLVGGCLPHGAGSAPHVPLVEMLRHLSTELGETRTRTLLTGPRSLLRRLLPDGARAGSPEPMPDREAATHLHEAVRSLLEELADPGLLMVVEDIHWASTSTRNLLAFLGRNLPRRALLVATFRTDELHRRHPLLDTLAELVRLPEVERIDVGPLSEAEQRQQAMAIHGGLPDETLLRRVVSRAEGNAFYLEELLAAAGEDEGGIPPALRDVLTRRLAALPDGTIEVLRVAAAVGRRADHTLLARVAGLAPPTLRAGLRSAVEHGVLVAEGRYFRFRHALLQERVHDDLLPGERLELHAAIIDALEDAPELAVDGPESVDAEIAHHAGEAMLPDRAYTASLAAAERAAHAYAFGDAREHLERALALWHRCDAAARAAGPTRLQLLARTATAAEHDGEHRRSIALLEAALDQDGANATAEERAALLTQLGFAHGYHGEPERAMDRLEAALAACDTPSPARANALATWALALLVYGRPGDVLAPAQEAVALAREVGDTLAEVLAGNALGGALMHAGHVQEGERAFRAAIATARVHDHLDWAIGSHQNLADQLETSAAHDAALDVALEGLALAESRGWGGFMADGVRLTVAGLLVEAGRPVEAEGHLDRVHLRPEGGQLLGHHLVVGTEVLLARGRREDAVALFAATRDAWRRVREPQHIARVASARARVALAQGELDLASDLLDEVRDAPVVIGRHDPVRPLAARVLADRALGSGRADPGGVLDGFEALETALGEMARAAANEQERERVATAMLQVAAERSRAIGQPDPRAWARAEEAVSRQGRVPEVGRLRLLRAEALLALGRREEAAGLLGEVHADAQARGLVAVADGAKALSRRARMPVAGVDLASDEEPFGLTPREREVLSLVALGLTNREIGERLFITGKTASVHVSNLMAKMDASTRGEAAMLARRHGLDA